MFNEIPKIKFIIASIVFAVAFVVVVVFVDIVHLCLCNSHTHAHKHTHIRLLFSPFDLSFLFILHSLFICVYSQCYTLESRSIDSIIPSISHFHIAQSIHLADKTNENMYFPKHLNMVRNLPYFCVCVCSSVSFT